MDKPENLNVLTIGNSFTDSLAAFFPQVVESAGRGLHFERANHGGCELHRHWSYILNEEKDGAYRMYQDRRFNMREILTKQPWDVVSIQQGSHFSWRPETYQPFANNIHAYIKRHAPQAEVVIQQTWAYRSDDPRIMPGGTWLYDADTIQRAKEVGIDLPTEPMAIGQDGMHAGLTAAYTQLAKELKLRVIPTGLAVKLSRENEPQPFKPYDQSLMQTLRWPDLPSQAGDVVGNIVWYKDKELGELKLGRDTIHLNARGQYMQACVWFAFLYQRKTSEVTFVPDMVGAADAAFLREMAQRAVDGFPQVVG